MKFKINYKYCVEQYAGSKTYYYIEYQLKSTNEKDFVNLKMCADTKQQLLYKITELKNAMEQEKPILVNGIEGVKSKFYIINMINDNIKTVDEKDNDKISKCTDTTFILNSFADNIIKEQQVEKPVVIIGKD